MDNNCKLVLTSNGRISKLHARLTQSVKPRSFANYIYAAYRNSSIPEAMDAAGYIRDKSTEEHQVEDVMAFMKVNQLTLALSDSNTAIGQSIGAYDSNGNPVEFADFKQAFDIANNFNSKELFTDGDLRHLRSKVAQVVKVGNVYKINIMDNNSLNYHVVTDLRKENTIWGVALNSLTQIGFTEDEISEIKGFNPMDIFEGLKSVVRLQRTSTANYSVDDCKTILQVNQKFSPTANFISRFSTIDEAAQMFYTAIHSPASISSGLNALVGNIVLHRDFFPAETLIKELNKYLKEKYKNNTEDAVTMLIKELQNKFKIDIMQLEAPNDKIKSLMDAAMEASLVLAKQLRHIQDNDGNTAVGIAKENELKTLMEGMLNQQTYTGLLTFMREAQSYMTAVTQGINDALLNSSTNKVEYAMNLSNQLSHARNLFDGYFQIASALTEASGLISNENISQLELDDMQNVAKQLVKSLKIIQTQFEEGAKRTAAALAIEFIGDEAARLDIGSVANMVEMRTIDSSIWDTLYSMGRVSNPLIATMGAVIRDTQKDRDEKLSQIALRIRRATDKLYHSAKDGNRDTSFMYTNDGHIIYDQADIDWHAYYGARKAARINLKKQHLNSFEIKEALDRWEEQNTEEIQVSPTRMERIPNYSYQHKRSVLEPDYVTQFEKLTPEQRAYYYEMMSIKGELGDNLPAYAQQQFRAIQIRKSWLDIVSDVAHKKMAKERGLELLWDKLKVWKVREDDTDFAKNGYISDETGEENVYAESDFKGEMLNKVPIFYFNRLQDSDMVMKDFSGALQSWASTVCNYEAMSSIENTVNVMADFISSQSIGAKLNGFNAVDAISNGLLLVTKGVTKKADANFNKALVRGFMEKAVYGKKLAGDNLSVWGQITKTLIAYTGLRQLAANTKGAISNYLVGEIQNFMEACSGSYAKRLGVKDAEFYTLKDWAWAQLHLFGDNTIGIKGRICDFFSNDINTKPRLLQEMFDPLQDNYSDMSYTRYHYNFFRQICGGFNAFGQYAAGEYLIHYTVMYARLHHIKVKKRNGEATHNVAGHTTKYNLTDAFDVKNKVDGNSELIFNKDFVLEDGSEITPEYLDKIKGEIQYVNQNNHGSMNEEDKGLIHRYMAGKAVMSLRQWMVEHYSKRFRGVHYDYTLKQARRGMHEESAKFIWDIFKDSYKEHIMFYTVAKANWNKLDDRSKQNVTRALAEYTMLLKLLGLSFILGDPKDHKGEWAWRMAIYQIKRALMDEEASTPLGMPNEGMSILQNPLSITKTYNDTFYIIYGLLNGDVFEETKEGENKYLHKVTKYSIPFLGQIQQMLEMDEDDSIFNVFNSDRQR